MKAQDQVNELLENHGITSLLQMIINRFEYDSSDREHTKQLQNHFKVTTYILKGTKVTLSELCDNFNA